MDGFLRIIHMVYNAENFRETVLPENKLSEGIQLVVKELQKRKESGFSVFDKKEYKEGIAREKKVLETLKDGPQSTIIEANKILCKEIVNNPKELAA